MSTITVRNLPSDTVAKLRVRAAQRGRSMESDVRETLVALADGARLVPSTARAPVADRVAEVRRMIRDKLGALPKGRVDALLAERKLAAERGE